MLFSTSSFKTFVKAGMLLLATTIAGHAQQSGRGEVAPGVNPKDNVTKTEVILSFANFDAGAETATVALKFDYAFDPVWGANIEVPFTRFSAPGFSENGIGDVALRMRNVQTMGRISIISAAELVAPTASEDSLGTGKWQLNPVLGGVYAFDDFNFAFLGYKHYFSVGGSGTRADIDRSEVRGLVARLSPRGRWVLGDLKYAQSHVGTRDETLDLEFEYGMMVADDLAVSGRIGTSFLDSSRQSGLTINLRKIW